MFGLDDALEWAMAMEAAGATSEEIEAAMSRFPRFRKAISYGARAGVVKNAYKDARGSFRAAQSGVKRAMSWGNRIRRDIRHGLARGGTIERRLGMRSRQKSSRAAKQRAARGRTYGASRAYPIARTSTPMRRAKKNYVGSKYCTRSFDHFGEIKRPYSLWFGFQHHGSYDYMWTAVGEAVARALLSKAHIYPHSHTELIASAEYDTLRLLFKRIDSTGADEFLTTSAADEFAISGNSLGGLGLAMGERMKTNAQTSGTGYFPYSAVILNTGQNNAHGQITVRDLGDSVIHLICKSTLKMQNLTKNREGSNDLSRAGHNPIQGRKYVFRTARPELHDYSQINAGIHSSYDDFQDAYVNAGFCALSNDLAQSDNISHPPPANKLFKNCAGDTHIKFAAGAMKRDTMSYSLKTTLREFIYKVTYKSGSDNSLMQKYGGVTWYGLERSFRVGSDLENQEIHIGYNRDLKMYTHCKLIVKRTMISDHSAIDLGYNNNP